MRFNRFSSHPYAGFTLIETIIGIVVLSIALSVIVTVVLPANEQSAGQVQHIRAAELGQSLMIEILARRFDENSAASLRCGEDGTNCTESKDLGPEEANRALFDDVDDFAGYRPNPIVDAAGNPIDSLYNGFGVSVTVMYDGNYDGVADIYDGFGTVPSAKLITVIVTMPSGDNIEFSGYRSNF